MRAITALAITVGCLLAPNTPAVATAQPRQHPKTSATQKVADQADRASAQAKKTGKPVPVAALTTATSTTTATPRGTFIETQTLQPTRVKHGRSWVNLDPHLRRGSHGRVVPNATTSGLSFSAGGTGPLATMTDGGISLSFTWPTALPAPTLHGASATYANVLPDVDLVATATEQGGFSHVLVVKTRTAAANPALARLTMQAHGSGLVVSADRDGNLSAGMRAGGPPVFGAEPAVMWDSATTAPARTASPTKTTAPGQAPATLVPDLPDAYGVKEPGLRAHTTPVKTAVAALTHPTARTAEQTTKPGNHDATITLTPDAGLLSDPSTVFPVYIDPTWNPLHAGGSRQAWASVSSAIPSTTKYKNSFDPNANVLQSGHVDGFTARSFIQFSVSSVLKGATIDSSDVKFTVDNDGDEFSHAASETDLWSTGNISTSISWNNQPSWNSKIDSVNATNDPGNAFHFDATAFMKTHATTGAASVTFGLRAPNESDESEWEEFYSANSEASMSTEYDRAPGLGRIPSTSPGGTCQTGVPTAMTIGNDDVTFSVVPNDPDGGQLGTEFIILDYGTSTIVYDSGNPDTGSVTTTSGTPARLTLKRDTIQKWKTDGNSKAYNYSWYVVTSDGKLHSPSTGLGTSGSRCHFTYDPNGAPQPGLTAPTGTLTLGQQATVTVAPCQDALADSPATCTGTPPTRYSYQINQTPALSVTATGTPQTITFPLHHVGPNLITIYGLSAGGNPGPINSTTFNVDPPTTPHADGDIDGDGNPDFLTNTAAGNAGLLMATSDGHGKLTTPINIGALGTGINTAGSPADWNGAQILHGDFTQNHVQDVAAYYPSDGTAVLLSGNGDTSTLSPYLGNQQQISSGFLADSNGDSPTQLVAAANASQQNNAVPDLIGISGDATNGYQLDLYTSPDPLFGDYGISDTQPLAGVNQTPDGTGWDNYTLTTAQPGGNPVLLALNTTTGTLYESTNPTQDPTKIIGSPASTWTPALSGTLTTGSKLISAAVNTSGQLEVWAQTTNGTTTTATAYTLTGTSFTQEASTSLLAPLHDWPLGDGNNATTAVDTDGGTPIQLSPTGASWATDDFLNRPVADLDGSSGYLKAPDGLIQSSTTLSITLSFKATPGKTGILISTGHDVPSALNAAAMPVMYIGTDERLYAQFSNGFVRPMISPERVDDDQWHTVTLGADGNGQSLYLDDDLRIGMAGSPTITNADPQNYIGGGVFPANTATLKWINAPGDSTKTRANYFTGQVSDVIYHKIYLHPAQVAPYNQPIAATGAITSQISSGLCIADDGNRTNDGNPIMIWTCDGGVAQQWTITPDTTDGLNNTIIDHKCMTVSGGGTANGTAVVLSTCDNSASQEWHVDSVGQLWNPHANKCLTDPGSSTSPGTFLVINDCDFGNEQNWHIP